VRLNRIKPNSEGFSEILGTETDVMESAAVLALDQMNRFGQAEFPFFAEKRPNPVGWDVIPVRQKCFEHPLFYDNDLSTLTPEGALFLQRCGGRNRNSPAAIA